MGRFETLKPETQDMVNAMLPAIASSFKSDPDNFKDIIPEDIRMRQWDCDRRDHIKDKTEDEPRNWGVEFLKCLQAIARLNGGNIPEFQDRLREKVAKHAEKHPWARLEDIRLVRNEYQNPALRDATAQNVASESESDDSLDSYLEELVDQDLPKGTKRGYNEAYESRVQGWWKAEKPKKPKKPVRLRRDPEAGWDRRGKNKSKSREVSQISVASDTPDPLSNDSPGRDPKRRRLTLKRPVIKQDSPTIISDEDSDDEDIEAKKMFAELEAAEAELELKRKRFKYYEAKEKAKAAKAAREASTRSASVSLQNGHNGHHGRNDHDDHNSFSGFTNFTGFSGFGGHGGFHGFSGSNDHDGFRGFGDSNIRNGFRGFTGFSDRGGYFAPAAPPIRQGSQRLPTPDEAYEQESDEEDFEDEEVSEVVDNPQVIEDLEDEEDSNDDEE